MESLRTSETSVNFNVTTRRYSTEDSKLQFLHFYFKYFFVLWYLPKQFLTTESDTFVPMASPLQYVTPTIFNIHAIVAKSESDWKIRVRTFSYNLIHFATCVIWY
jgi:hypothetical protein